MIEIKSDFSGSIPGRYRIKWANIYMAMREETATQSDGKTHDYSCHFAFDLKNSGNTSESLYISFGCESVEEEMVYDALLYAAENTQNEFHRLKIFSKTDTFKKYHIPLTLEAGQTLYIANFYYRSHERLQKLFEYLAGMGKAVRVPNGKSIGCREFSCYRYGEPSSESLNVMISSGFHFPEGDTIATEKIMEHLSLPENRKKYADTVFHVIPKVNPDGFFYGYNGCNHAGFNLYWEFDENDTEKCPEVHYLWQYCLMARPNHYFDFHSYIFQLHRKKAFPYVKPLYFYQGALVRDKALEISRDLMAFCRGKQVCSFSTYAPSVLATKLTWVFNTVTFAKYHFALFDGIRESADLALKSFEAAMQHLQGMKAADWQKKDNLSWHFFRELMRIWVYQVRPFLVKVKNRIIN